MNKAIQLLEQRRQELIEKLKTGQSEILDEKLEIDQAIMRLKLCDEYGLFESKKKYEILKLPFPIYQGYFSEYRVMDDCESDDMEHWIKVIIDGKELRLVPWDIIIHEV